MKRKLYEFEIGANESRYQSDEFRPLSINIGGDHGDEYHVVISLIEPEPKPYMPDEVAALVRAAKQMTADFTAMLSYDAIDLLNKRFDCLDQTRKHVEDKYKKS